MANVVYTASLTWQSQVNGVFTYSFHGWTGWVKSINSTIDRDVRGGDQGATAQSINRRSSDTQCATQTFFVALNDALDFAESLEDTPDPTPYTLVDPWGRKLNVRVVEASVTLLKTRGVPVNGQLAQYLVSGTLMVERLPDV